MESCSRESIFKRYYSPQFVFTKPDYLFDEDLDNFELRDILDNARNLYNKSPKKENRQPSNGSALNKVEKSKRGSYNFINQNPTPNPPGSPSMATFITRDQMQKVPEKRRKKSLEEKNVVWMLPK